MATTRDEVGHSCFETGDEVDNADLNELCPAPCVESYKGQ